MKWFRNHRTRRMLLSAFLALALLGVLTGGSLLQAASLQESLTSRGLTPIPDSLAAPAFRLPDLAGKMVSLQEYQGKIVMLYFWTTW